MTSKMSFTGILETDDYEHFRVGHHTFEGAKTAATALPGDTVQWFANTVTIVKRARHVLVGTLELNSKTRYGMTSHGVPLFLFNPFDESYPPFYVGSKEKDLTRPQLAIVTFDRWETGSVCPRGILSHGLIGPSGDPASEKKALLFHHGGVLPKEMIGDIPSPSLSTENETHYTVSIDPEGCRDIDDAISVMKTDFGWSLKIHIADVAAVVSTAPWLFTYAKRRGQTFYESGRAIRPMLPPAISEGVCSLLEKVPRAVLSLSFLLTKSGDIRRVEWSESVIVVDKNHTYESVYEDSKFDQEPLQLLSGSTDSHKWVEYAMLFYNRAFAQRVMDEDTPGILRRHSPPDLEKLTLYKSLLSSDDLSWMAFKSAEYCWTTDENTSHWGLSEEIYCHATSPIRRFADLYNQLIVKNSPLLLDESCDISTLNQQSKAAKRFDRDCAFVDAVLSGQKEVEGIVLPGEKLWIPSWRQIVRGPEGLEIGSRYIFKFHVDPTKRSWKRRIVFAVAALAPTPSP